MAGPKIVFRGRRAGKTTARLLTLEAENFFLRAEVKRLKEKADYMADPNNWIEEDGWLKMKRPGGGGQAGIFLISHDLKPWVYLLTPSSGS